MKFGLYIHIPFCEKKCFYCDFSTTKNSFKKQEEYINLLLLEMEQYKKQNILIDSIYIGGGTPGLLEASLFDKLMNEISNIFILQIVENTIEMNPNNHQNEQLIKILTEKGVNRVSIGVQSFSDKILKYMGRNHISEDVHICIDKLKNHNINNYSIDLIYGIENQFKEDILNDLYHIKNANPSHVSWYNLIIEEKTKLYQHFMNGIVGYDETKEVENYSLLVSELNKMGYEQYEISNFSRDKRTSYHNLKYWRNQNYIGLGVSASSYINGRRFTNPCKYGDYKKMVQLKSKKGCTNDRITKDILALEFLIMRMRLKEGLSLKEFQLLFNINLQEINKCYFDEEYNNGNIEIQNGYIHFTTKGFLLSNLFFKNIKLNA